MPADQVGTAGHHTAGKDNDLWTERRGEWVLRTCVALLKVTAADLGTDIAGGEDVTSAQNDLEKACVCQGAQTV